MIWSKDREYSYLFFSNRVDKNTNEFCVINDILLASICDIYKISKQEKFAALRSKKINLKFQKFPLQNVSNTPPSLEQLYSKKYFLEQARPQLSSERSWIFIFSLSRKQPFSACPTANFHLGRTVSPRFSFAPLRIGDTSFRKCYYFRVHRSVGNAAFLVRGETWHSARIENSKLDYDALLQLGSSVIFSYHYVTHLPKSIATRCNMYQTFVSCFQEFPRIIFIPRNIHALIAFCNEYVNSLFV